MNLKESIKEMEDKVTPLELIDEIIECANSLYSEEVRGERAIRRLPEELRAYSGYISIIHRQAMLLKKKLLEEKDQIKPYEVNPDGSIIEDFDNRLISHNHFADCDSGRVTLDGYKLY